MHPEDIVRCRVRRGTLLSERGQLYRPYAVFVTTRERAESLDVDILEIVQLYAPPASVPVERRRLRRTHNRLQRESFDRAD